MWKYFPNYKAPYRCKIFITKYIKGIRVNLVSRKMNGRTWALANVAELGSIGVK